MTVLGACDYRTLVSASSYFVARMAGVLAANLIAVGVALALALSVSPFLGVLAVSLLMAVTVAGLTGRGYGTDTLLGVLAHTGLALGLGKRRIFLRLILPQMWRLALPGLGNLFMILMKDTALVSVIGLEEIMRHAQIGVTVTKEPFTFYMVAACIYLGLTVIAMTGMHFMEKRAARGFARAE